jgi:hypothetical protein
MATWLRFPLCFEALSPIHVGFLPKSRGTVVAPTRAYIPGKNFWGAITASLVPRLYDAPTPADFTAIGDDVRKCLGFSYFYLSDGHRIFTPSYESGGLEWAGLPDAEFRSAILDSRLSTEISETGAAEDGGLHEIEFIRHRIGSPAVGSGSVFLCGVAWLHADGALASKSLTVEGGRLRLLAGERGLDLLEGLIVGGERNYGFGRIRFSHLPDHLKQKLEQMWPPEPDTPFILNRPLLGHAEYRLDVPFRGQVEIIASREYPTGRNRAYEGPGAQVSTRGHYFAPGTYLSTKCQATYDRFGQLSLIGG